MINVRTFVSNVVVLILFWIKIHHVCTSPKLGISYFHLVPESKPSDITDCGVSIFYTHRQSRSKSLSSNTSNLSYLYGNASSTSTRSSSRSKNSLFENDSQSSSSSRRNRNSRVMRWKAPEESSKPNGRPRIVNGIESKAGSWPWLISLQLRHPTLGFVGHWCGGVLISDSFVLTAAHCIQNRFFKLGYASWFVLAGEYDRSKSEGTEKMIGVSRIFVHERFKEFDNDIALVKLSRPIKFTPTIKPVCLPNDDQETLSFNMTGVKCVATGWGMTSARGKLSSKVQQVWVDITSQEKCHELYQKAYRIGIRSFHLCAGPVDDKISKGTCVGDSCNFRDGRWYLVGVTSFGSGCARPGFPDVYSRITYYLPWIRGKIRMYS